MTRESALRPELQTEPGCGDLEPLLAERGFLKRLARNLVESEQDADDLEQATWYAALRRNPGVLRDARGFLGRIVRNLAHNMHRDRLRRAGYESAAEPGSPTADMASDLELQERVVAAVRALPENLRAVVYLRYYKDLRPVDIARDLEMPVATVKARLARGRETLRSSLDRSFGGRAGWCFIATSTAGVSNVSSVPTIGIIMGMSAPTKIAFAAAAIAGVYFLWPSHEPRGVTEPVASATPPVDTEKPDPSSRGAGSTLAEGAAPSRERLPESRTEGQTPTPEQATSSITARVVDPSGQGFPGIAIEFRGVNGNVLATGTTDAAGILLLTDAPARPGLLACADPEFVMVNRHHVPALRESREIVVLVAPKIRIAGRVMSEIGEAVGGARVAVYMPRHFRHRFGVALEGVTDRGTTVRTDASGRFLLDAVPRIEGCELRVTAGGFAPHAEPLPLIETTRHFVTLTRPRAMDQLRGFVLDERGRPVEGATVSFGGELTKSGIGGDFVLDTKDDARRTARINTRLHELPTVLIAAKRGHAAALYRVERDSSGREIWPPVVTLRLGAAPLSIRGRVVDVDGSPLQDARVWLDNPTFLSVRGRDYVEALIFASSDRSGLIVTDDEGRFEVGGLLDRRYRIGAMMPATMLTALSGLTRAGTADLRIVLDTSAIHKEVHGRVVDDVGSPMPGATLRILGDMVRPEIAGQVVRTRTLMRSQMQTDARGRFVVRDLPKVGVYLFVDGDETFPTRFGLDDDGRADLTSIDPANVTVAVERKYHLRVLVDDPELADRAGVVDADGRGEMIYIPTVKQGKPQSFARIADGKSLVFEVKGRVRWIELFQGAAQVARIPVRPEFGTVVTVRH